MQYKTEIIKQNLVGLSPKHMRRTLSIMAPAMTSAQLWQLAVHLNNSVNGNSAIATGIDNSTADFMDGSEAKFDAIHPVRKNITINVKNKDGMILRFCAADPDGYLYFYKLPPKVWRRHAKNHQLRKKWDDFFIIFKEYWCSFKECCE
jgi:hypothetical protein